MQLLVIKNDSLINSSLSLFVAKNEKELLTD